MPQPPQQHRRRLLALPGLALLLAACGSLPVSPETATNAPAAAPPHHTTNGFRNNHPGREPQVTDLLPWAWQRLTGPSIRHDASAVPWQAVDEARLRTPASGPRVTWLGHATVLIEVGGQRILTDPMFSERASPLSWLGPRRLTPLPLAPERLPHIDAVLISHNHHDHLDLDSLRRLARQPGGPPRLLVPLGDGGWLRARGLSRVEELDWWQSLRLDGLKLTFVPVQHWSQHFFTRARDRSLWGGYVLTADSGWQALFAGDTGYSPDFREIRRRLGAMDLALLPIGAYQPRWLTRRQHIDPAEAVRIHQELEARLSLGMHWGTFVLSDEPIEQPGRDLATARAQAALAPGEFPDWAIGETRDLEPGLSGR